MFFLWFFFSSSLFFLEGLLWTVLYAVNFFYLYLWGMLNLIFPCVSIIKIEGLLSTNKV